MNPSQTRSIVCRIAQAYRARQTLPPAQHPWVLYGTSLATLPIACWILLTLTGPATTGVMPFEFAASYDDLTALRIAWQQTCDAGFTPSDRADLVRAMHIAAALGHDDILNQLHAWGVHDSDDDCEAAVPWVADPFDLAPPLDASAQPPTFAQSPR